MFRKSADLDAICHCNIATYDASTDQLRIFRSMLERDTVPRLQYIAADLEDVILPVNSPTSSEGALYEGIMDHKLTVTVRLCFS